MSWLRGRRDTEAEALELLRQMTEYARELELEVRLLKAIVAEYQRRERAGTYP